MMRGYLQLTLSQLRLFGRNRQVLIWSLFFPIFFMIMLGSLLGNDGGVSVTVTVVDRDGSPAARTLVETFKQAAVLDLSEASDLEAELGALKRADRQLVVEIPKGYGEALAAVSGGAGGAGSGAKLLVHYDQTNLNATQVGLPVIGQIADGISKGLTGYKPVLAVEAVGVQSLNLKYIDFLVPGIVAMMIMSNNLNGVAGQIASWRERGILRRMQSTPLHASTFIAAQITARLVLNAAQAIIVLLVGSLVFGTQVNGSWLLLLFFVVVGTLCFMSIGFIIASLARTPESAGPIAGLISFPMMFLGNVFFPIKNMPEFLQPFVKSLPITHLSNVLRQVMNVGAGLGDLWVDSLLLFAWMIGAFVVSSLTFRWE